jgi:hypothetical protein
VCRRARVGGAGGPASTGHRLRAVTLKLLLTLAVGDQMIVPPASLVKHA